MFDDMSENWIREYPNKRYAIQLKEQAFKAHQREFHIFAYIQSGSVSLRYRERELHIGVGDTIFIRAGEIHSFAPPPHEVATILFHYIDTLDVIRATKGITLPQFDNILETKRLTKGHSAFLLEKIEHGVEQSDYMTWLHQFCLSLCNSVNEQTYLNNRDINILTSVRSHIQSNLDKPFILQKVAERVGIDKYQLSRKFSQLFGVSLFQHIHASRIVEAKKLLAQGESISSVAIDLGYSDQSHFNRFFKRFVGISPTIWVHLTH